MTADRDPTASVDEIVRRVFATVLLLIGVLVVAHVVQQRWPDTWIDTTAGMAEWIVLLALLLPLLLSVLAPVFQVIHGVVRMVARGRELPGAEAGSAIRIHPSSWTRVRAALSDSFGVRLLVTGVVVLAVNAVIAAVR